MPHYQAVTPPPQFIIILNKKIFVYFLAVLCLFSCTEVGEDYVDPSQFGFTLLEVKEANEVSIEKIKKNLKSPTGWTIESIKIADASFGYVTGTSIKDLRIKIKKAGTFAAHITLQNPKYGSFTLKATLKATLPKATPSDFKFPPLAVHTKEIPLATITSNLKSPSGWHLKGIKIKDDSFAEVTGIAPYLKIHIKKSGTFKASITLQKTGYADYVLEGAIKASLKANPSDFKFPLLLVRTKELSVAVIKNNLTSPAGWNVKSIQIDDGFKEFAEVTGTANNPKINIKKSGTFTASLTLQKTGYLDHTFKGTIKATLKAAPSDFSFPILAVGTKEVFLAQIISHLKSPSDWSVKNIQIADGFDEFATVTGIKPYLKINIKKSGTFTVNVTLQKTGYLEYVLKGTIKANLPVLKKPTPSDFGFSLLAVGTKEISIETIKKNIKAPTGWRMKSIQINDPLFGNVTGIAPYLKLTIKKSGTFTASLTLQKTGYEDYVLKGSINANLPVLKKPIPSGFGFPLLAVHTKELFLATITSQLKSPAGWTIKNIQINKGFSEFAEVMGIPPYLKINIKKSGTFTVGITLQKTGYENYTLKGNIKATLPPKKANPSSFGFSLLTVKTKEVSFAAITSHLKSPAGWTIKSIQIDNGFKEFADVSGTGKNLKINIKKSGTFTASITLQKTGYVDYVLKGTIKANLQKTNPSDFSFPLLAVDTKEVSLSTIKKNLTSPAGWSIKNIQIDDGFKEFADVSGTGNNLKIIIKKEGTFTTSITLQKTGYENYTLKGNIKATLQADPSKFIFPLLVVHTKEVPLATIASNLTSPAGWSIKSIQVVDNSYANVTGIAPYFKLIIKKSGTFKVNITLQKTGYVDYTLRGNIQASLQGNPSDFSFTRIKVKSTTNEIPVQKIKLYLKKPSDWTIKSIQIHDAAYATVTGTGNKLKITLKKAGLFGFNITLQKTGYVDFVLRGCEIQAEPNPHLALLIFDKNTQTILGVTDKKSIKNLEIPSQIDGVAVTKIYKNAFRNCPFLATVKIPNSVTSIGNNAFQGCGLLASVTIGNSVTSIGLHTFRDCTALISVTIGNSVTSIESHVFSGCSALISVNIPNSVTSIRHGAFSGCSALISVSIPNSVTSIVDYSFDNCRKLVVTVEQINPSKISLSSNPFGSVKQIKVPSASLSAYKSASGWSSYSYKMVGY